jgi:hypothetical protein
LALLLWIIVGSLVVVDLLAAHLLQVFEPFVLLVSPAGATKWIVCVELLFLCATLAALYFQMAKADRRRLATFYLCLVGISLSALFGALAADGKIVLSAGALLPGSLPTRLFLFDIAAPLRRLFDPIWWLIFTLCSLGVATCSSATRASFRNAMIAGFGSLVLESLAIDSRGQQLLSDSVMLKGLALYFHLFLSQLFLLSLCQGVRLLAVAKDRGSSARYGLLLLSGMAVAALGLMFAFYGASKPLKPLAGAHYYLWFPYNWKHGHIADELRPKIKPLAGRYSSKDAEVFSKHVAWAKSSGLDFFIFDWWPERKDLRAIIYENVRKQSKEWDGLKFAIQYETLDLKSSERSKIPGEDPNMLTMTPERARRMKLNWEHIAKHYMHRDTYLKVNGRPVLFVYAARHMLGPVAKAVREAKAHVKAKTGLDLYLVGDEVYFNVPEYRRGFVRLKAELEPNWSRLTAFDAITCYNPYDSGRTRHAGVKGAESFISDVSKLYSHYRKVSRAAGIPFIPGVLPGYNDRGVRLNEDHFVLPRQLEDGDSFFDTALEQLVAPFLDPQAPVFAITSWNEWNEGTQIEPTVLSGFSNADSSEPYSYYTKDEWYSGYGCQHLEELGDFLSKFE